MTHAIRFKLEGREDLAIWQHPTIGYNWCVPFVGFGGCASISDGLSQAMLLGFGQGDWPEGWIEFDNGATIYFDYRGIGELYVPWMIMHRDELEEVASGQIKITPSDPVLRVVTDLFGIIEDQYGSAEGL